MAVGGRGAGREREVGKTPPREVRGLSRAPSRRGVSGKAKRKWTYIKGSLRRGSYWCDRPRHGSYYAGPGPVLMGASPKGDLPFPPGVARRT